MLSLFGLQTLGMKRLSLLFASFLKTSQLERIIPHTDSGYERCVFTNAEMAIQWLEEQGYPISNRQYVYDKFNLPAHSS